MRIFNLPFACILVRNRPHWKDNPRVASVLSIAVADSSQATYLVWLPVTKTFLSSPALTTFLISMLV